MTFGRKVHDRHGPMLREQAPDQHSVTDIAFDKQVPVSLQTLKRLAVAGIGQQVQIDHARVRLAQHLPHEIGTDEAGAAGDKNRLHVESIARQSPTA